MPHFKIAHLREQGQSMIIVPLDSSFEHKSDENQRATIAELQVRARRAGLEGMVVPVWQSGGRTYSIAPLPWRSFFQNLSMRSLLLNVNKELYW